MLALLCGVLYGVPFVPVSYLQQNVPGVSKRCMSEVYACLPTHSSSYTYNRYYLKFRVHRYTVVHTVFTVHYTVQYYIFDFPTKFNAHTGLDYCFSQYLGVWLTGMLYMLIYSFYKRSLPDLYPRVLLPGFLCGSSFDHCDYFVDKHYCCFNL